MERKGGEIVMEGGRRKREREQTLLVPCGISITISRNTGSKHSGLWRDVSVCVCVCVCVCVGVCVHEGAHISSSVRWMLYTLW